jgi:hypothetical protein
MLSTANSGGEGVGVLRLLWRLLPPIAIEEVWGDKPTVVPLERQAGRRHWVATIGKGVTSDGLTTCITP